MSAGRARGFGYFAGPGEEEPSHGAETEQDAAGRVVGQRPAQAGQRFFPYSVPVAPKAGSQLDAAAMQTYGDQALPPVPPPTVPTTRIQ